MKKLSEQFNNVSVKKGERFIVELPTNGSTGYMWDLNVIEGKAKVVSHDYFDPNPPKTPEEGMICGNSVIERTVFEAEETGTIKLQANYHAPGKKGRRP